MVIAVTSDLGRVTTDTIIVFSKSHIEIAVTSDLGRVTTHGNSSSESHSYIAVTSDLGRVTTPRGTSGSFLSILR